MKHIISFMVLALFVILVYSCAPIKEYKIIPQESINNGAVDKHPIEVTDCQSTAKITFDQIFNGTYRFIFRFVNHSDKEITISSSDFTMVAYSKEKSSPPNNPSYEP